MNRRNNGIDINFLKDSKFGLFDHFNSGGDPVGAGILLQKHLADSLAAHAANVSSSPSSNGEEFALLPNINPKIVLRCDIVAKVAIKDIPILLGAIVTKSSIPIETTFECLPLKIE